MNQHKLDTNILEALIEAMEYDYVDYDTISDLSDSLTPTYYDDILDLVKDNIAEFGLRIPDTHNDMTPIDLATANIYEYIERTLQDYLQEACCTFCDAGYQQETGWEAENHILICPVCGNEHKAEEVLFGIEVTS